MMLKMKIKAQMIRKHFAQEWNWEMYKETDGPTHRQTDERREKNLFLGEGVKAAHNFILLILLKLRQLSGESKLFLFEDLRRW